MITKYKKHVTLVLTWLLISALLILAMMLLYSRMNSYFILGDFIVYWSSGQLLLNGDNPYSWYQLLSKQQSAGWPFSLPLMLHYSPPWAFTFILPFCMQNYAASKFLWFLFHLGLVFICTNWTWRLYDGPKQYSHIYLLLVFTFAPVLFMLQRGQIVPLVLLGVLGFLHFEKKKNGWLAGCFLLLIAIKPHILYLFWMALLLWILERRKWSVMFGGVTATLTALLIPMIYNPDVINQYILLMNNNSPPLYITPTIGTLLRMLFKIDWIQYLPTLGGTLWFISYWMKHHKTWEWDQQMPSIIIVSLMTTPYLWINDYAILILPMAQVAIRLIQENQSRFIILIVFLYLLVDVFALVLAMMTRIELHFVWMVPALFVIYLLVSKRSIFATGTIEERLRRHEHDIRDA